jgi:hypothetical protein
MKYRHNIQAVMNQTFSSAGEGKTNPMLTMGAKKLNETFHSDMA